MEIKICTFARTDKDVTVTGKTVYRQRSKERNKIANKENTKVDPNIKKIQSGSGGGSTSRCGKKQNKDSSDFKEPVRQREAERLGGKKRKRKGWFGKKEKEEDMRQQLKGSSGLGNG